MCRYQLQKSKSESFRTLHRALSEAEFSLLTHTQTKELYAMLRKACWPLPSSHLYPHQQKVSTALLVSNLLPPPTKSKELPKTSAIVVPSKNQQSRYIKSYRRLAAEVIKFFRDTPAFRNYRQFCLSKGRKFAEAEEASYHLIAFDRPV